MAEINLHDHLQAALDLAADGNVAVAMEHLMIVYTTIDEDPFLLWEDEALFDLGSAFLLMYHFDLSEREKDQLTFVQYAYLFLARALDRELTAAPGSFQELYGKSEKPLEIVKNLLMVLDECEDELSIIVADMLAPTAKNATPEDATRQKAIEQARVIVRLIQFAQLETIDQHFPDFNDDEFLIGFSNELEEEYGLEAKDAELGRAYNGKLFDHIAKSV